MLNQNIFVVIVSHNAMKWVDKCILSIESSSIPVNIIFVDNCSEDNTVHHIEYNYKFVEVIQLEKNIGFGQGNNIGISQAVKAGADYVFLLNQDAWVDCQTIETLVKNHKGNQEFGIVSPVHMNGVGDQLDGPFHSYLIEQMRINRVLTTGILFNNVDKIFSINFVNAAAWLISKEVIKKVGGFDPLYSHWGEDNNYIDRLRYHDFQVGICSKARIFHDRENSLNDRTLFFHEQYYRTKLRKILDPTQDTDLKAVRKEMLQDFKKATFNLNVKRSHQIFSAYLKLYHNKKVLSNRALKYAEPYCFVDNGIH